jgi:DNA-binding transcriptional regulator YdaS (Cro superfamily)
VKQYLLDNPGSDRQAAQHLGVPSTLVNQLARRPFSYRVPATVAGSAVLITVTEDQLANQFDSPAVMRQAIDAAVRYDQKTQRRL